MSVPLVERVKLRDENVLILSQVLGQLLAFVMKMEKLDSPERLSFIVMYVNRPELNHKHLTNIKMLIAHTGVKKAQIEKSTHSKQCLDEGEHESISGCARSRHLDTASMDRVV